MAFYDPVKWVPYLPWAIVAYIAHDAYSPKFYRGDNYFVTPHMLAFTIYALSNIWSAKVSQIVPEPYLDEIFHIPQAQAYCAGDFHVWDPKLTTPPGLYAFASALGNLARIRNCDVETLRWFSTIVLVFTSFYAASCYSTIARYTGIKHPSVLHNAFNIALFPPLFFFSGLFYTDVLSTCVVLKMYRDFLYNRSGIWLYLTGLLALTMRQTNIFWVAVFLGGLEVVRTLKTVEPIPQSTEPNSWKEIARSAFHRYERGEMHDIPLCDADLYDFVLCPLSIAIAVLFNPILILKRLWPYISILITFAYFVYWNGGVVLGDKQNHVATIHLPQLLYLWPFIAFFSFPLLLPAVLLPIAKLLSPSRPASPKLPSTKRLLTTASITIIALLTTIAIIKYNTIIHPFTLADNRHYMFYIFRYSILLHPSIRYLLAPIYILAFYLCYTTLAGPSTSKITSTSESTSTTSPPTQAAISKSTPSKNLLAEIRRNRKSHTPTHGSSPPTSIFLIWLLATSLSLMTAPLVEPRYFILPWLMWRLHVPSFTLSTPASKMRQRRAVEREGGGWVDLLQVPRSWREARDAVAYWGWEGHDPRLWVETGWFVVVNLGTAFVFLYKGFEWKQEPGNVQRFMW